MLPRILASIYSLLYPWKEPVALRRSGRREIHADPPIRSSRRSPPPTLQTLNVDVFRLIALEVRGRPGGLKDLASCSRALRHLTSPVLFARCVIDLRSKDYPPEQICCYIRHIKVYGPLGDDLVLWVSGLIETLPALNAVTLDYSNYTSWEVLKRCFKRPRIKSLTLTPSANFTGIRKPYPLDDDVTITLSTFAYNVRAWREEMHFSETTTLRDRFAREAECLKAIVLRMNRTATHLTLPIESAPLDSMTTLPWPKLQELILYGRYLDPAHADALPALLCSLTHLRILEVRAFRDGPLVRPPILGRHTPPHRTLSGLRSLTIAYPDPHDDIFVVNTSELRHLSLRDWPRYYHGLSQDEAYSHDWTAPILTAAECLYILRRMNLPQLSRLELVYLADAQGSDDELLVYVTETYPQLSELELHRYRADREEQVCHVHITNLLSAARSLRVARLNLDFHEDHGPYCDDFPARKVWRRRLTNELGWELVRILEEKCPYLERVDVLYHGIPNTTWAEFHSSRSAEPRFVLIENHPERWDPESLPVEWYRISQYESYETESEGSTPPPEDASLEHPQETDCTSS